MRLDTGLEINYGQRIFRIYYYLFFVLFFMATEVAKESRERRARLAVTGLLVSMAEQGYLGPRDLRAS